MSDDLKRRLIFAGLACLIGLLAGLVDLAATGSFGSSGALVGLLAGGVLAELRKWYLELREELEETKVDRDRVRQRLDANAGLDVTKLEEHK